MNDAAADTLTATAVDALHSSDACELELLVEIVGGVGELGEDDDLPVLQVFVGLEHLDEGLELVVLGRINLGTEIEEIDDLVEVHESVVENFVHLVEIGVEALDRIQIVLGDEVLIFIFGAALVRGP